ncbi:hypothetical protein KPZU09_03110 [Klebsiella pneumoniae]|uniref:Uncharacterized protein n=1 Tax=Klebsiella pneumoniae TaxID=573 RepID=A0A919LSJ2_KLEPN|nr:hypothetical protein KPZU09_03110 [Klebsiella pneumoniae]
MRARRQNNSPAAAAGELAILFFVARRTSDHRAHQIHPVIIRFHYGKMQRRKRHDVANARDMTIGGDHQPGNCGNILIVIDQWIQPQRLLQRMQVGRPLNKPAIAIDDNLWRLISVREFTGNGFKDVQRRDQPLHHAKFISYDDEAAARPTQDPEQIDRVQRFRNDNCRGGRSQRRDVFPDSGPPASLSPARYQ